MKKKNKHERIFLYTFILLLMLFSFLCGFYVCGSAMIYRSLRTPKVMEIPRTNGNSMRLPENQSI